jgi:hypothetical protein
MSLFKIQWENTGDDSSCESFVNIYSLKEIAKRFKIYLQSFVNVHWAPQPNVIKNIIVGIYGSSK